jgi:hypothetical protein
MPSRPLLAGMLLIAATALIIPGTASGGPELSFSLGAMIGDSLGDVLQVRPDALTADFQNAPFFAGRVGWSAFPFALEGSLAYSPSAVTIPRVGSLDANLLYAEAEIQILILPGPIAPFVGGGIGIHSIQFRQLDVGRSTSVGYTFGGGLKAAFGSLGLRVDLRDHITPLKIADLDPDFVQAIGLGTDTTIHNVEFSGGITIRF